MVGAWLWRVEHECDISVLQDLDAFDNVQLVEFVVADQNPPIFLDLLGEVPEGEHLLLVLAVESDVDVHLVIAQLVTEGHLQTRVGLAEAGHVLDTAVEIVNQHLLERGDAVLLLHVHEVGDVLHLALVEQPHQLRVDVRELQQRRVRDPLRLDQLL